MCIAGTVFPSLPHVSEGEKLEIWRRGYLESVWLLTSMASGIFQIDLRGEDEMQSDGGPDHTVAGKVEIESLPGENDDGLSSVARL